MAGTAQLTAVETLERAAHAGSVTGAQLRAALEEIGQNLRRKGLLASHSELLQTEVDQLAVAAAACGSLAVPAVPALASAEQPPAAASTSAIDTTDATDATDAAAGPAPERRRSRRG